MPLFQRCISGKGIIIVGNPAAGTAPAVTLPKGLRAYPLRALINITLGAITSACHLFCVFAYAHSQKSRQAFREKPAPTQLPFPTAHAHASPKMSHPRIICGTLRGVNPPWCATSPSPAAPCVFSACTPLALRASKKPRPPFYLPYLKPRGNVRLERQGQA